MKALAHENQYQPCAIIDGKPVDAGVFDGNIAGLLKMKNVGKGASTFAVTVEPRGGKSSPSLETMQVLGNVTKGQKNCRLTDISFLLEILLLQIFYF